MSLGGSIRAYMMVRPRRLNDALRLFVAFAASLLLKGAFPSRFRSVGLLVLGRQSLCVRVENALFEVRPGTNDLDLVSAKHEPLTKRWFQASANEIVIDVGAHIGRYAVVAARRGALVFAVEPDPSNFAILQKNMRLNRLGNVVFVPLAMSSRVGILELSLAERWNTGTSSVVDPEDLSHRKMSRGRKIQVSSETLDNLVKSHRLERIDWLKVDAEGHEVDVLGGGEFALKMTRRIILEVSRASRERAHAILDKKGFDLIGVEEGDPTSNLFFMKRNGDPPTEHDMPPSTQREIQVAPDPRGM